MLFTFMQGIAIKDNDSLSAMLAAEVQADLLILMSDVDGIYNKPPWEDGAKLMHTYTTNDSRLIEFGKKSKVSTYVCMTTKKKSYNFLLSDVVCDDSLCKIRDIFIMRNISFDAESQG